MCVRGYVREEEKGEREEVQWGGGVVKGDGVMCASQN